MMLTANIHECCLCQACCSESSACSRQPWADVPIIDRALPMSQLRHREVKSLARDDSAGKLQGGEIRQSGESQGSGDH